MKNSKPSHMTKQLDEILNHKNYLGLTSIISKLVKCFLSAQMKPLLTRRIELRAKQQKEDLKDNEKEQITRQVIDLTL